MTVTTSSGSEREIPPQELIASWPFIARGEAKSRWQHLSKNTSYLEAIYDLVTESSDRRGSESPRQSSVIGPASVTSGLAQQALADSQREARMQGVAPSVPLPQPRHSHLTPRQVVNPRVPESPATGELVGLRNQVRDMNDRLATVELERDVAQASVANLRIRLDGYKRLQQELEERIRSQPSSRPEARTDAASIQGRLARLAQELATTNTELTQAKTAAAVAQAQASAAQLQVARLAEEARKAKPSQEVATTARIDPASTENQLTRLAQELATTNAELTQAKTATAVAQAQTSAAELQVAQLTEELRTARSAQEGTAAALSAADSDIAARPVSGTSTRPVEMTVVLDAAALKVDVARRVPADMALGMSRAASRILTDSDASVGESRRALESAIKKLGVQSLGSASANQSIYAILADLRGDAGVPDADWHLMKNIWSRSSAIVHDGGATPEVAMWIWLGLLQIAELVGSTAPPSPRAG